MYPVIELSRAVEIATMALHKLKEVDADMAQRFMQEEIDMSKVETEFLGMIRERKAIDIEWDIDYDSYGDEVSLPSEVDIPWDVLDDDIDSYLTDRYGFCVCSYDVEEED